MEGKRFFLVLHLLNLGKKFRATSYGAVEHYRPKGAVQQARSQKKEYPQPDQQRQLKNNLPAYTVGSLRAHVQVECLVDVINDLVLSDNPQEKRKCFTQALHEMFTFGRSKKHMIQRQLGRLEPTPALKYRAHEVMRNRPVMST